MDSEKLSGRYISMTSYGRHYIDRDDINAVVAALQSECITQGSLVPTFEKKLSQHVGADYCVASNSGTSALILAYRALGLRQGDTVWTTPISFVATANAALICNANVNFIDIDSGTFNISENQLKDEIYKAKKTGSLPKIITTVHLAGQPCNMEAIYSIARENGISIVEDAAHALGSSYLDTPIGACKYSDITTFSFHPVKSITTGEGGASTTNNPELHKKMLLLRSHGVTKAPSDFIMENKNEWYYEQHELGYNFRMTDIQAALGLSQLEKLTFFLEKRKIIAQKYDEVFEKQRQIKLQKGKREDSANHLYILNLASQEVRDRLHNTLKSHNIGTSLHYIPIYLHPFYQNMGFKKGLCPNAERYYKRAITIPLHPLLSENDIDKITELTIKSVMQ